MHRLPKNAGEAASVDKAAEKGEEKRDVRMQLITTAVFAVGKILGYASVNRESNPRTAGVSDLKGTVDETLTEIVKSRTA